MTLNQRRLLPSTSMLSAFEAAARLGSFSNAAKELSLTQGAISRQIRALEKQLGMDLFIRNGQKISLNNAGMKYFEEISSALNIIRLSTLNIMTNSKTGELKLAVLPTFGAKWLIPKLASFIRKNPEITVSFTSHILPFDIIGERLDAAIHYGSDDWPNAKSIFLMRETVMPIYSPLLEEKYDLSAPENFRDIPLLHLSSRRGHWTKWFNRHDIEYDASQGMSFEQFSSVAQAACAGLGVALMPKLFVENELSTGALMSFDAAACESSSSYYLIIPNEKTNYHPVSAFHQWILEYAD